MFKANVNSSQQELLSCCFLDHVSPNIINKLWLLLRSRLRGSQGARLYTMVHVWVPAGLRGACSGRLKSRNLPSNQGIAFRPARANQAHATPSLFLFLPLLVFLHVPQQPSKSRQPRYNTSRALSFSLCGSHERCFCVWIR